MKLDKLKLADIKKLDAANEASLKAGKESLGQLKTAHQMAAAAEKEIEAESQELETTDDAEAQ
jgi:hypothetical protein